MNIRPQLSSLLILLFCSVYPDSYNSFNSLYGETAEGVFPAQSGTAQPLWRKALGGAVTGVPTIQAGSVVAVLDGGNIKAFTLEGNALWDYFAKGKLAPYVSRSREGTCYVYRLDGTLIAVNRAGRELWRIKLDTLNKSEHGFKAETLSAPILSGWDGRIFVSLGMKLFCYTASGYRLWVRELERLPLLGPIPDKSGGLVMVLENGELVEIDYSGNYRSRVIYENPSAEIPSVLVPFEGGTLVVYKNGSSRFFRNRISPEMPVSKTLPNVGALPLGGVSRGNKAAILLSNGKLVQFSINDGTINWTGESHVQSGEIVSDSKNKPEMIYDERGIYVFTAGGASGFTADGQRLWLFRIRGAASIPALSDEGVLYSGGSDWILYAYKLEERMITRRNSLYGPLPEGSYGLGNPPPSSRADFEYYFTEERIKEKLNEIARKISEGNVREDEAAYTAYLMEISGSAMNPKTSITHPPVQVQQRSEAVRLLGYIGSRETIAFLSEVFTKDSESSVKAAAARAIGRIGVDPDGIALSAFTGAALSSEKDEQVLIAAAEATGSLCRFSGPPLSESGIKLLNLLGSNGMPSKTRAQVRRELESFRIGRR